MLGKQYIVKSGDTLWDIAKKELGSPLRWPEIHSHNNSKAVTIVTGFKIIDPDLIFVGQKIYIPNGKTKAPAPKVPSAKPKPNAGKKNAARKVRSIPFKYDLEHLPSITLAGPAHISTITLKGSVTMQAKDAVDFATLTKKGFEITAKRAADHALGKLVTEAQIGFNPNTKEVTFECGLTAHSNNPYSPKTKVAAAVSSKTGLPVLKGSITVPELKGKIDKHLYVANGLGIEIEITPIPPSAKPKPKLKPSPKSTSGWEYLVGAALIVGAGVIVVAAVAEDLFPAAGGPLNDPPAFAAASAMATAGIAVFTTVKGGKPISVETHGIPANQL